MKNLILATILMLTAYTGYAQNTAPVYDKALAEKTGADDYGMKSYILVMLKTGTNTTTDKSLTDKLFRGHMENIERLAKSGKLVVAGPISKNDKAYRGIFILNVKTPEEAAVLLETDPAVKEKLLEAELYKWYGSAALAEYLPFHDKIQKKKP